MPIFDFRSRSNVFKSRARSNFSGIGFLGSKSSSYISKFPVFRSRCIFLSLDLHQIVLSLDIDLGFVHSGVNATSRQSEILHFVMFCIYLLQPLRNVGNIFVVNLALADLCVTGFINPFSIIGE